MCAVELDPQGLHRVVCLQASFQFQGPELQHLETAKVPEEGRFYAGPLDVDQATNVLAEQINETYWAAPGKPAQYLQLVVIHVAPYLSFTPHSDHVSQASMDSWPSHVYTVIHSPSAA